MRCDGFALRVIVLAIGAMSWHQALANPTGPTPIRGVAGISGLGTSSVTVNTNDAKAIINWQGFSIGGGETTTFTQPSPASAVLNRVTSASPSAILGSLQSNGRVFLINPNGIAFGTGSTVDVAGLVASSLNLSNDNFVAGKMSFSRGGAGPVINNGTITTTGAGAPVYLIGPSVTNSGIITSPQGEVVLAAGRSVQVVDPGTPDVSVQITASKNKALNLGSIVADAGRVNFFGGLVNQDGIVRANTVAEQDGRIVLKASRDVELGETSSTTALQTGGGGGLLDIKARDIVIDGFASSGDQTVRARRDISITGTLDLAGTVSGAGRQEVHAGRSLLIDASAHEHLAFLQIGSGQGIQSISATNITVRGIDCAPRCPTILASAFSSNEQRIVVQNGGELRLESGAAIQGSVGYIDFPSGGRLVLQAGSGDFGHPVFLSHSTEQHITGSPDITLSAGNQFANLNGGVQTIHARSITLDGGGILSYQNTTGQAITIDRGLTLRDGGRIFSAKGDQNITVGRNVSMLGGLGPAEIVSGNRTTLDVEGNVSLRGGTGSSAHALISSAFGTGMSVGGILRMQEGTGQNASARVQTQTGTIDLHFPNRASGGWFVNGIAGAITNGASGFWVGASPAALGNTLIVDYGP